MTANPPRIKCSDCPIRHRALCARCDDQELERLDAMKTYRGYRAGDVIFWQGEEMPFIASIVHGSTTLSKTLEDGRVQVVGFLLPSDYIGGPGRNLAEFEVKAATDVTLCCFERRAFEKMLSETPSVAQRLMELALDDLDAARDWMVLLGRKTAREKIATFLVHSIRRSSLPDEPLARPVINMHLTRSQMANLLGLTHETVSRQLNALKREGVLRIADRRRLEVQDVATLRAQTGDPNLQYSA